MDYLEDVGNLLAIIRSRGWDAAFAEDVLYGVSHSDQHRSRLYGEPLLSLRQVLEDSKRCMSMLSKITECLGRKIRRLEKRTIPLVLEDGIRRLPDELLANIFTLGHLSTTSRDSDRSPIGGDYALRGVSHVSHRFREISLVTPILWSRLSVLYPDSKLQAFLSRSGQVDLEIDTYHPFISNFKEKLKTLSTYSHRWSRLLIMDEETERFMQKLGLTKFPRLRHLYHECPITSTAWQMPLLSHIECSSCHFGPGVPFLEQLTTFEVSFEHMDSVNLDEFAQVVHNMSNLRKLSVQLIYLYSEYMFTSEWPSGIFERHSVEIDELTIRMGKRAPVDIAQGLHDALSFLMANTMEISLDRGIDGEQLDLLVDSDGDFAPFASVLKLRISEKVHFMHLFTAIGQYCDIAHTVHFDLPKGTYFTDGLLHDTNRYTPFPSIRHIQFTNCASLYEEQLDCMVKHPLLAQIEDFEIVSCPNISEDFLLDLRNEVGDKLKWSSLIPFHPSENHDSNNEDTEHYYPPPDSPQFDF